jgi:hypothetical protein
MSRNGEARFLPRPRNFRDGVLGPLKPCSDLVHEVPLHYTLLLLACSGGHFKWVDNDLHMLDGLTAHRHGDTSLALALSAVATQPKTQN